MLYTIEDSTLTAMGDAIRGYKVGTNIGLTDNFTLKYSVNNSPRYKQFSLDGEKIKIRFNSILVDLQNGSLIPYMPNSGYNVGDIGIINSLNNNPLNSDINIRIKPGVELPYEVIADSNEITIYYTGGGSSFPVVIDLELIAVDENGEEYKYTPLEMVDEVYGIIDDFANAPTIPDSAFNLTGDCNYRFAYGGSDWLIEGYGDKITTTDITKTTHMFDSSKISYIPFEINCKQGTTIDAEYMFYLSGIVEPPKINNFKPSNLRSLLYYCKDLEEIPEDWCDNWDWSYIEGLTSSFNGGMQSMLCSCYKLRKYPNSLFSKGNPVVYNGYAIYYEAFKDCYSLDEVIDLPFPHYNTSWTSDAFYYIVSNCHRLKNFTFKLQEDGTPYVMKWKSQTIDLSQNVGYTEYTYHMTNNANFTDDTKIKDDATYQALKDNPDNWASNINYSRYNHDSAVNTINSLPDCSATGTNTIKFQGAAGALTDGGAINTLTEEEIAVAAAKGWTVTFS